MNGEKESVDLGLKMQIKHLISNRMNKNFNTVDWVNQDLTFDQTD